MFRSAWWREALRCPLREERGGGTLCRHAHSLLITNTVVRKFTKFRSRSNEKSAPIILKILWETFGGPDPITLAPENAFGGLWTPNSVSSPHYDHISSLLVDIHWLRMAERIQYKLCVLVYRCLHGSAPCYLQQTVCPVASMESRRRLRSVTSSDLMVPATRRSTLGDRAFAVAGPRAWNNLPTPSVILHHWKLSNVHSIPSFFSVVFFA